MKKCIALLAALMLLCTLTAFAEEPAIPLETLTMEDGFTFTVPALWSYMPITEEMDAQNMFIIGFNYTDSLMVSGFMYRLEEGKTLAQHAEEIASEGTYSRMEVVTNEKGYEVLRFEYEDGTLAGYEFLLENGYVVNFMYGYVDRSKPIMEYPGMDVMMEAAINTLGYAEK